LAGSLAYLTAGLAISWMSGSRKKPRHPDLPAGFRRSPEWRQRSLYSGCRIKSGWSFRHL